MFLALYLGANVALFSLTLKYLYLQENGVQYYKMLLLGATFTTGGRTTHHLSRIKKEKASPLACCRVFRH